MSTASTAVPTGTDVVDVIGGLRVPSIVIAHTVLKDPTAHQRSVLEAVVAAADRVVVMSEAAKHRLCGGFDVDRRKVVTIPHGATLPDAAAVATRHAGPTLLTWGLLGPGKGIERVIDAMAALARPARPAALPGRRADTSRRSAPPTVRRIATRASSRRVAAGVADSVSFDADYRDVAVADRA